MIKCFFADIKSISSDIPRSAFDRSKIEHLADVILATDGLIRPLILKQTGLEQYTVIEGNLEYYAAVRAKEKDSRRAEMVNAFIIPDNHQQFAIEQLTLLSGTSANVLPNSTNITLLIEQLTSIITQQLQPLQQQLSNVAAELVEHKNILKSFGSRQLHSIDLQPQTVNVDLNTLVKPEQMSDSPAVTLHDRQPIDVILSKEPADRLIESKSKSKSTTNKKLTEKSKSTKTTAKVAKSSKIEPVEQPLEPKIVEIATPAITKSITTKKAKSTTKPRLVLDPSIDPIKAANTLDLINTLSEADLLVKMQKSGVPAGGIKLVSSIINKRNLQPEQKFDSWEIAMSEVAGLKSATAATIISKLK